MSAIFLTGTDTDIGKTVITTLLVHFFKKGTFPFFLLSPFKQGPFSAMGNGTHPTL